MGLYVKKPEPVEAFEVVAVLEDYEYTGEYMVRLYNGVEKVIKALGGVSTGDFYVKDSGGISGRVWSKSAFNQTFTEV